jgi:hypothetical protein
MKYAKIKNNKIELISYQFVEGYEQVNDNVFADMIKKSDGSFNYSDEFLAEQEQFKQDELVKKQAKIDAKASALAKLSALGLTEEEVQAIIK